MLLDATAGALRPTDASLLTRQMQCINNVQRASDWKHIEFLSKRWLWVRWPTDLLFSQKERFRLATISCQFGAKEALVEVWAVDGHVSSLQASTGLSGLSIAGPLSIQTVTPGT